MFSKFKNDSIVSFENKFSAFNWQINIFFSVECIYTHSLYNLIVMIHNMSHQCSKESLNSKLYWSKI